MKGRHLTIRRNGSGDQIPCNVVAARLVSQNTQLIQGVGVVGVNPQYVLVKAFRFGQMTALVMSHGFGKQISDGRRVNGGHGHATCLGSIGPSLLVRSALFSGHWNPKIAGKESR
jgi:hypothetical protein